MRSCVPRSESLSRNVESVLFALEELFPYVLLHVHGEFRAVHVSGRVCGDSFRSRRIRSSRIRRGIRHEVFHRDRKSTRLNSSHRTISYAVFCLKKKKKNYV